jgi:large subunit ribosomal protein L29
MRPKELRELSDEDLRLKRAELEDARLHLRLRRATGQLENPMKLRETKRDLARVLTIQAARARSAGRA